MRSCFIDLAPGAGSSIGVDDAPPLHPPQFPPSRVHPAPLPPSRVQPAPLPPSRVQPARGRSHDLRRRGRDDPGRGAGTALRVDLVVEAVTYAGLLLTRDPVVAAALLAFLSANLAVFSSVGATLRQFLAPPGMLGRVQGAYRAISTGLLAGAALGGLLTSVAGLTAPLWLGLGAITMDIALAWRPFGALGTAGVSAPAP